MDAVVKPVLGKGLDATDRVRPISNGCGDPAFPRNLEEWWSTLVKKRTHGLADGLITPEAPSAEAQKRRRAAKAMGALSAALVAGWAQRRARRVLLAAGWTAMTCITVWTAIAAKEGRLGAPVLAELGPVARELSPGSANGTLPTSAEADSEFVLATETELWTETGATVVAVAGEASPGSDVGLLPVSILPEVEAPAAPASPFDTAQPPAGWEKFSQDASVRWFNGRPVRPVREVWMTVTAYSPHEASCGDSADGITATLHHVSTNGHALVAADPTVLPYGSMITVPGYDQGRIVPVLDCGGAIKGRRLDVLFPTHEQAIRWGVRRMKVTVWGYADGAPKDNPRALR